MFLFMIPWYACDFPQHIKIEMNLLSTLLNIAKFSPKQFRKSAILPAIYESAVVTHPWQPKTLEDALILTSLMSIKYLNIFSFGTS